MATAPAAGADAVCSVWQTLGGHNGAATKVASPPAACTDPNTGAAVGDPSKKPPCTTCLPVAVGTDGCDWWYLGTAPSITACQALQADGLPGGKFCQTVTWCGKGGEGDVFADACFCGSGAAWIAPTHKQSNIDSAVCLKFGTDWGWHLLLALAFASAVYFGGGVAMARRAGGSKQWGLRAHPHVRQWEELRALCNDGVAFARSSGKGGVQQGPGGGTSREQLLPLRIAHLLAAFFFNFRLKIQKEWLISPENR